MNEYSWTRRLSRLLGRLGLVNATIVLTLVAMAGALLGHVLTWRLLHSAAVPKDYLIDAAIVTILVATPIIFYAQIVIRQLGASRRALRKLTEDLALARDTLEAQVVARTAELSAANEAMEQSVVALQVAKDHAETANYAKSQFLANVSHELRTPLNAIIGFSQILTDQSFGPIGSEQYLGYAADINESGRHLLSLVHDLLDMSQIEVSRLQLAEKPIDIDEVIGACVRMTEYQAENGKVAVTVFPFGVLPYILGDALRLRQISVNLLSNAVKFTPPGGKVTVAAAVSADGAMRIAVSDTGIGMTEPECEIALQPFRQVENWLTRQHEGMGLGLPIAKSLAELHGAVLTISSTPQAGTTVTIAFPADRLVARSAPVAAFG